MLIHTMRMVGDELTANYIVQFKIIIRRQSKKRTLNKSKIHICLEPEHDVNINPDQILYKII
jgi:hypothetical protein